MSNLDKLFEKKLADHSITPSGSAWESLEAKLSKKNKPLIWMRWAAILLLGVLGLGTLWLKNQDTSPVLVKESIPSPAVEKDLKPEQVTVAQHKPVSRSKKNAKIQLTPKTVQPVITPASEENEIEKEMNEPIVVAEVIHTPVTEIKIEETVRPMVIVYTLAPVSVPDTEHVAEELIVADKKDNSLKKMMKMASEVKNSESPLGGFRDMKEELFAFDLKKKTTTKKH